MQNSKYSKVLTIGLIILVIIIIGLLIFWGVSAINSNRVKKDAEDAVDQMGVEIGNRVDKNKNNTVGNESSSFSGDIPDIFGDSGSSSNTNTSSSSTSDGNGNGNGGSGSSSNNGKPTYKGFPTLGSIEIPAIKCKYPILEKATKDALEVAICHFGGVGLNQPGNATLAGHNYRNGTLFSNVYKLANGDKIYITDNDGNKKTYVIYQKYETTPEDAEYVERPTDGATEITLTTCTDDSQARTIVFARAED